MRTFGSIIGIALMASLALPVGVAAQSNYSVKTLGMLGGVAAGANSVNNRGWVAGSPSAHLHGHGRDAD